MMHARSLAMMIAGALGLFIANMPSALGQAVPRPLPPEPPPELPSVSDYSLPPGDQAPANNQAEGPVEENAPPPQAAPTPNASPPVTQPADGPIPVSPVPQADTNSASGNQSRPAPLDNARPNPPANPIPRAISEPSPASRSEPVVPANESPAISEDQPQPGFTTELPSQALPAPDAATETAPVLDAPDTGFDRTILYYIGGGLAFLLLGGLGAYFWRRKTAVSPFEDELANDPGAATTADDPEPDPEPWKPAPKIYSPPNPAETKKPVSVPSNGFVTSKIGVIPEPPSPSTAIPPVAPKPSPAATTNRPDHLQVEFVANGASSTLLNAVLNYSVTLTNTSDQDLRDIHLSGAMMQADSETARNGTVQTGDAMHKLQGLAAGESVTLTGEIRLPLNAIRPITFKSQALFIPLARFGVEYADQNNAQHQQVTSFIVGREYEPPRPKMAPFRLDLGPRSYGPVGQRPLNA